MTTYKRKKVTKQRGNRWHGWGRGAAHHKGAGNRGGRGRAGSGKRGDAKKPSLQWEKGHKHKGRVGFKMYNAIVVNPINISLIEQRIQKLVEDKVASKKGTTYVIDLKDMGYNKLLGTGKVTLKYEITTDFASESAVKKIEAAGGKVLLKAAKEAEGEDVSVKEGSEIEKPAKPAKAPVSKPAKPAKKAKETEA